MDTFKILGQSSPAATTQTTLYTVPAATQTTISSIVVCNQTTSKITFRIRVKIANAADAIGQYLWYDTPVPANQTFVAVMGITLGATDVLTVYANVANVSFNAFGVEIT